MYISTRQIGLRKLNTSVLHLRAADLKRVNSFENHAVILRNIMIVLIQKLIQRRTIMDLKRV